MTRIYESGGKKYDYYGVIRNSQGGSVKYSYIIEHGFHTNEKECAFLLDESNLRLIARAEAEAIAQYFSLSETENAEDENAYTVQKGDTLSKIASLFGVTLNEIAKANSIENVNLIYAGQKLVIPEGQKIVRGDIVRLKDGVTTYFPGGNPFSPWVKNYDYVVMKDSDGDGKTVYRGGDECVLLGERVNRTNGELGGQLKSWCSINYIDKVK
jgi:LysM repeat protein